MTTQTVTVEVSRRIAAPPERVFDAWLDAKALGRWLFATADGVMERIEVDARVGGRFEIDERRGDELARHWGTYVEIDRPRRLVFDFATGLSDEPTRITVTVAPDGDGSLVTLRHDGVWSDYEARTRHGWGMVLGNLDKTLA